MKTEFEDTNVSKIILSNGTYCPPIHLVRYIDDKRKVDGYYLSTDTYGIIFTDLKGNIKFIIRGGNAEVEIYPLNEALERARTILRYFENPLPREDVTAWLEWIIDGETNEDDIKVYKKLAKFILDGKQKEGLKYIEHQDTFVRDGVSKRIWQELECPSIPSEKEKMEIYERGVIALNEASNRVSKMTVAERGDLIKRSMENNNET